jgi:hypothetical protein
MKYIRDTLSSWKKILIDGTIDDETLVKFTLELKYMIENIISLKEEGNESNREDEEMHEEILKLIDSIMFQLRALRNN